MVSSTAYSLKSRVLNAGAWSFAGYAASYMLRLGSNLLLTRLLVPESFGLIAIAMTVLMGLALFSDVGLKPGVVHSSRGDEPHFLNTAWVIQILRGLFLSILGMFAGLAMLMADRSNIIPSGSVYADPKLPFVVGALSFTLLVAGLESTKSYQASRNLLLSKLTKIDLVAQLLGFLMTVAWAMLAPSIWALVSGAIFTSCVRAILTHAWLPGVSNRLRWDPSAYGEIIRFGKWIFLSSLLFFLASNGDRIMLGGLISPASLGTYAIAFLIFSSIDQVLGRIIVDVSFPALSEIVRQRRDKLKTAYYRFQKIVAGLSFLCAGVLMVAGQTIIALLYDRRYQQAGWILEILSVALLTIPFRLTTQTFLALGLSRTYFMLNATRTFVLFAALPIGFHLFELRGAVWGVVLSYFSSLPIVFYYARKVDLIDIRSELAVVPVMFVGMAVGAILNAAVSLIELQ